MTASDDSRRCARIARAHARTFALASSFLPAEKRRAAFALYAFCRVVDDLVDLAAEPGGGGPSGPARQAAAYAKRLDAALAGRPDDAVFRELARTVDRFRVPAAVLHDLVRGVRRDLEPVRYGSWAELVAYCGGVASTVGEMCTYVFGVRGGAGALDHALVHARTLGVAMQLTNILRDVGEDARRGRCYLPDDELARFGLVRDEVLGWGVEPSRPGPGGLPGADRWPAFMRFQIRRARRLYADALPGVSLLSPDAQRCAAACALGYAGILEAIERRRYDTFSGRARLPLTARASVVWRSRRWPRDTELVPATERRVPHHDDVFERA